MVDSLAPVREASPFRRGRAPRHERGVAPAGRPAVAAHDPSDPDYTAGDVDELVRWQQRTARSAVPRTR